MKHEDLDKYILMHYGVKGMKWRYHKGLGTPEPRRKRKRISNPFDPTKEPSEEEPNNKNKNVKKNLQPSQEITNPEPEKKEEKTSLQILDEIYAKIREERQNEAKLTIRDRIRRAEERAEKMQKRG